MKAELYLSGPMSNTQLDEWRQETADHYGDVFDFLFPAKDVQAMDEEPVLGPVGDDGLITYRSIVQEDKERIRNADGVLVGYEDVKSVGTDMEIMHAVDHNVPVYMWICDGTNPRELSMWYTTHTEITRNNREIVMDFVREQH